MALRVSFSFISFPIAAMAVPGDIFKIMPNKVMPNKVMLIKFMLIEVVLLMSVPRLYPELKKLHRDRLQHRMRSISAVEFH